MNSNCGFATLQIHEKKKKNAAGALCAPIYQTSTFEFDSVEQGGNRFAGKEAGYIYTRIGNPSLTQKLYGTASDDFIAFRTTS